jgi:hypothetical protein
MQPILEHCSGMRRELEHGTFLLSEGRKADRIEGQLDVSRGGMCIALIREPGSNYVISRN